MRDEYLAHGLAPDRVHTIPLFAAESCMNTAPGALVDVLFLGRMTDLKGPSLLLTAARAASSALGRPVSLVMAGDGPLRDALRASAATLSGVDASFPGWVDTRGRTDLFGRTALLAVPSVWPEPFGLVGLEAAAFGIPAVAFDVGGIREWLADGVNGRLIGAGDTAAMGEAIAALLKDSMERARLGAGARAASKRLSAEAHLSRLEAVLNRAQHS